MKNIKDGVKPSQIVNQISETMTWLPCCVKDKFIAAIRKFMQMDELTAPLLRSLLTISKCTKRRASEKVEHSESQFTTALWGTSTSRQRLWQAIISPKQGRAWPWNISPHNEGEQAKCLLSKRSIKNRVFITSNPLWTLDMVRVTGLEPAQPCDH